MTMEDEIKKAQELVSKAWDLLQEIRTNTPPPKSAGDHLIETIRANVNNSHLNDQSFRIFIRNALSTIPGDKS